MKRYAKTILTALLASSLILSMMVFPTAALETVDLETVDLEISLGTDQYENYDIITNAIKDNADANHLLNIKIKESGTYYVAKKGGGDEEAGGAIMMRSNVDLDLNGSTLVRSGSMYNLFQNEDFQENRDNIGYNQTYNFTIKNGVLDGSGGSTEEVNLVNFGHANNITLEDLTFKNCRNGHLLELAGCKDVIINRCKFTGFNKTKDGDYKPKSGDYKPEEKEAIQLDICNNTTSGWNGVYASDNSVCENITVENCNFEDYPSGVGNHHTLVGIHNSGIKIINNTFTNKNAKAGYAMWCYGFDDSLVSGNTISGKYAAAIAVSGGSVNVLNNTVSGVSYAPLSITKSTSYYATDKKKTRDENAVCRAVMGNKFTTTGGYNAVAIFSGSKVSDFSGNTVGSSKKSAIICSGKGTHVTAIKENTITTAGEYGVAAAEKAQIDNLSKKSIVGKSTGVRVTSGALIKEITANTKLTSSAGEAIMISGGKATSITSNPIISTNSYGLAIASKAQVDTIGKNTISGKKGGIRVTSGAAINKINANTKITSSSGEAILISGAKVTSITSNPITANASYGLAAASKAQITTIGKNTISGKNAGIRVTSNTGITKISANKIKSTSGEAILISGGKVTGISSNEITSTGTYGLSVASKAQIDSVVNNTISGKKGGIRVTSNALIKKIDSNTNITSSSGEGILVSGATVNNLLKNVIKKCGANGITVSSSGKIGKIQANTISANKGFGLQFSNSNTTVYMGQNKYSSNKAGKEKIKATVKPIYTITYKLGGGTNNTKNPESYTEATSTITLKNPSKKGYTFKGWYSDSKYKKKVTKIVKGTKGKKTLYAKWKKK